MKTPNIKNFFAIAWPFFGLAFFLIWGWIYIKPMLPDDFILINKIKNIFTKDEAPIDPDAKYNFHYIHGDLKPKTMGELEEEIKNRRDAKFCVSTTTDNCISMVTVKTPTELQSAIKTANPGDTIELQSGIYRTKIFIDKDLTITGQGTSTVIIGGNKGTAIYAENSNFNISHCQIIDSYSAIKTNNASGTIANMIIKNNKKSGIELRNSHFEITENIITDNGSYGVFVDAYSEAKIEGNYIDENKGYEVRIEGARDIYR